MRLLNTSSYQLESFLGVDKPSYAILSHTWEPEGEILFDDLQGKFKEDLELKSGFAKVKNACKMALQDEYDYIWIDTCCIDKSSSAEFSEASDSMFRWYEQSSICYAFFADVDSRKHVPASLEKSRWFTRGWTLRELIAPGEVDIYDMNWTKIGNRSSFAGEISSITDIQEEVLVRHGKPVSDVLHGTSVAQRMRWASNRVTTREEDASYCLMGLFDVNMPLLYGEGKKAFSRLQEAIIHGSEDQSILALRSEHVPSTHEIRCCSGFTSVLAPDINYFRDDIRCDWYATRRARELPYEAGRLTLEVCLVELSYGGEAYPWVHDQYSPTHAALLHCICGNDYLSRPILLLHAQNPEKTVFSRCFFRATLLKATVDSSTRLNVIGGTSGDRHDLIVLPLNALDEKAPRTMITLENQRQRFVMTDRLEAPHVPAALDYHHVAKYCMVGHTYPKQNSEDLRVTVLNFVGMLTLRYKINHVLIVWYQASFSRPWCRIYILRELTMKIGKFRNLEDEDALRHIMADLKSYGRDLRAVNDIYASLTPHLSR